MDEYLALPDGAGRFPQDFSGPVVLGVFHGNQLSYTYGAITLFGAAFQSASISTHGSVMWTPTTLTQPKPRQFRLVPLRSSLLRESQLFSVPPATEIFQLAGLALSTYVFSAKWQAEPARFPHSEIHESTLICNSSWLIAAYHALRRLSMPRHPP
jgi:hypothetical protein